MSRHNFAAITTSNTIAVTSNALWIMFVPVYLVVIGLPVSSVALLFSLSSLTTAAFSPVGGRFADSIGRKPVAVIGRLLASLGALIIFLSASSTFSSFPRQILSVTGYLVLSSGSGIRVPATSMILMESSDFSVRGRRYMAAERVIPSVFPAITILVGANFFQAGNPEPMFLIGSLGLFVSALVLELFLEETLDLTDQSMAEPGMKPRLNLFFCVLVLAFVLDGASAAGVSWYVPLYLGENRLLLYGVLTSVSTLVISGFSYISGTVVDRFGARASLVVSWILLAPTVILFSQSEDALQLVFLYSIWVALDTFDTAVPPIIISNTYSKHERATRLGIFRMLVNSSLFLGPLVSGLLLIYGAHIPFYWKGLMNTLAAGLILLTFQRGESQKHTSMSGNHSFSESG